ncbi:MAG: hypothetical protein HUJ30_03780 [Gammaproteobacteria bacterium]|nr:hypothetical protein [Gammaproteobacteria bacterium]
MSKEILTRAQDVVTSFQESLDDTARNAISEQQYEQLKLMISRALSNELDIITNRIEGLVNELRSESEKGQLGM